MQRMSVWPPPAVHLQHSQLLDEGHKQNIPLTLQLPINFSRTFMTLKGSRRYVESSIVFYLFQPILFQD